MSVAGDVELRTLPPPAIDPEDVQAILPSLSPEDAALYASLATLALQAALWPKPIPDPPLPPPVQATGLSIAVRLARAGEATGEGGGAVVSESIGAYTYRLANPGTFDEALALTDTERKLLRSWMGTSSVFDVRTGLAYVWPADWWQRDFDLLEVPPPEENP